MVDDISTKRTWHAVRVHMPATGAGRFRIEANAFEDAVLGRDQAEAEANARHNWITGTPATPAERIDYLGPEYRIGDRVRSLRWNGVTGYISNRIEPGDTGNEDGISPRLFARWDEVAFEDEIERDDIAPAL